MSLRPLAHARRTSHVDPITALAAAEPLVVTDTLNEFGTPSVRAIIDACRDLPEHGAAHDFARGDRARMGRFIRISASLTRRSAMASADALERSSIPF
jgi:hypothetical protein